MILIPFFFLKSMILIPILRNNFFFSCKGVKYAESDGSGLKNPNEMCGLSNKFEGGATYTPTHTSSTPTLLLKLFLIIKIPLYKLYPNLALTRHKVARNRLNQPVFLIFNYFFLLIY